MGRDSISHTFKVAILLCLVCAFLVSGAAVGLRPRQQANKIREMNRNVLIAAGLWTKGADVDSIFSERVEKRLVDLESGQYTDEVDIQTYDPRIAMRDPDLSLKIPADQDPADVKQRENFSFVYLVKNESGIVDQVVLPIRGYGLWSTLWGFISLDAASLKEETARTRVRGITFYEHKETPGLGGEVDNPNWQAQWSNPEDPKLVFDEDWNVLIKVVKGTVDPDDSEKQHKVDGLSGATFTSIGVQNMVQYWLGGNAFGAYLKTLQGELRSSGGADG